MIDNVKIIVCGGHGGSGLASFSRRKFIPLGGPDGGDGGGGGDVVFFGDSNIDDLSSFKSGRVLAAGDGDNGGKWQKHGKSGNTLVVRVPLGTMIFSENEWGAKQLLADLITQGQEVVVARGGRGGFGNIHFATAVDRAPMKAFEGTAGERKQLFLEFKLMSDICIVGAANSGKSTLLSAMTHATPEVRDYAFTTHQPVKGVIRGRKKDVTVVEIPGLVKGAHKGKGLGNKFLCHVERAFILIYLLDGSSPDIRGDYLMLKEEMSLYGLDLSRKSSVVVVNKTDLSEVAGRISEIEQEVNCPGTPVFFVSAACGDGMEPLVSRLLVETESREQQAIKAGASPAQKAIFYPSPKRKRVK
jgi:GTP-binding protein